VQGLQEGAIDYICKPFSLKELLSKIEHVFEGGSAASEKPRETAH
jgi:DNA-binding response OmpR family regulator